MIFRILIYLMLSMTCYGIGIIAIKLLLHRNVSLTVLLFWSILSALLALMVDRARHRHRSGISRHE